MTTQYVIITKGWGKDEVIGPFSSEDSALFFARQNVQERYFVRRLSSPEFS